MQDCKQEPGFDKISLICFSSSAILASYAATISVTISIVRPSHLSQYSLESVVLDGIVVVMIGGDGGTGGQLIGSWVINCSTWGRLNACWLMQGLSRRFTRCKRFKLVNKLCPMCCSEFAWIAINWSLRVKANKSPSSDTKLFPPRNKARRFGNFKTFLEIVSSCDENMSNPFRLGKNLSIPSGISLSSLLAKKPSTSLLLIPFKWFPVIRKGPSDWNTIGRHV